MTTTVEHLSTQINKEIQKKELSLNYQFNLSKKSIKKNLRKILITTQNLDPRFPNKSHLIITRTTLNIYLNSHIKPLFKFIIGGKRFTAFKNDCLKHIEPPQPIKIYIDASYMPNSGEIGVGMVTCHSDKITKAIGCYEIGTVNRHGSYWAELKGIHQALLHAHKINEYTPNTKIEIFSDCESVLIALKTNNPPSNLFKRAKRTFNKSQDLLTQSHTTLNWVRAHNGHKYNEMADNLATQARISQTTDLVFLNFQNQR